MRVVVCIISMCIVCTTSRVCHVSIMHWSCVYHALVMCVSCTGHVRIIHLSCVYHALVMCVSCTCHVCIMHWSCVWPCSIHLQVIAHLLDKQLPPSLSTLYGPQLVSELSITRANLCVVLANSLPGLPSLSTLRYMCAYMCTYIYVVCTYVLTLCVTL